MGTAHTLWSHYVYHTLQCHLNITPVSDIHPPACVNQAHRHADVCSQAQGIVRLEYRRKSSLDLQFDYNSECNCLIVKCFPNE